MKYKQWNRAASAPQARAAMEAAGVPPLAALTLCARGLDTPEKASAFLDAGRGQLLDPFLMKDMDRATTTWTASPPPACSPTSSAGRGGR